jgi:hypothetical protein
MTDELLAAYVLNDLPAGERAAVDRAASDPGVADRIDRISRVVAVLKSPDPVRPPSGLVARTVAAVRAEMTPPVVPSSVLRRLASTDSPLFGARRRIDVIVAAGIGFIAFGLGLGILSKSRAEAAVRTCQNSLRELHTSLDGYTQTHGGRYPQVGVPGAPTAGGFAVKLAETGLLTTDAAVRCPAVEWVDPPAASTLRVGYTYALGYQAPNGRVVGLRRSDGPLSIDDRTALAGDFPAVAVAPAGGPFSPHGRGQNVLFAGGNVAFTTSANVGIDGDDVYRNAGGRVAAGLFPADGCLGHPDDRP